MPRSFGRSVLHGQILHLVDSGSGRWLRRPLALNVRSAGSYSLAWEGIDDLPSLWVLEFTDDVVGATFDMREVADYAFSSGVTDWTERFSVTVWAEGTTAIENETPQSYRLSEVYPNPFNPQARFTLQVAQAQDVTVSVFDLLGRRVMDLHQGALTAGTAHAFTLNGRDLASGFYVVRVSGETFSDSRLVTLLK